MPLWVAQGDRPLPCRLVITYKAAGGQPQCWGQCSDWNVSADVSGDQFAFTPPEDAARIAFAAHKLVPSVEGQQVEGQQKVKKGWRP